MTNEIEISPIEIGHIAQFNRAVDIVCREKKYLLSLVGPSLDRTRAFVRENIEKGAFAVCGHSRRRACWLVRHHSERRRD